jgi:hypothetical protein
MSIRMQVLLVAMMLQAKAQEQNDTDPLMWWKQHEQQLPRLARMIRQYLACQAGSFRPHTLVATLPVLRLLRDSSAVWGL